MAIEDCTLSTLTAEGQLINALVPLPVTSKLETLNNSILNLDIYLGFSEPYFYALNIPTARLGRELFPEPINATLTVTHIIEILPIRWTNISITTVSNVEPVLDSDFIIYPAVFLGTEEDRVFIIGESNVAENIQLSLTPLALSANSTTLLSSENAASLSISFLLESVNAKGTITASALTLNPLLALSSDINLKQTIPETELSTDRTLGLTTVAGRLVPFAASALLTPLNLITEPITCYLSGNSELAVIRILALDTGSASLQSFVFGELAQSLLDINYPIAIHDQVRHPLPVGSSYVASVDKPYSHNIFGAALTHIDTQPNVPTSLSAGLRSVVTLPAGNSYADNSVSLKNTLVMFRVSSLDTATERLSAVGFDSLGDDVNKVTSNTLTNFPTTYTGSVTGLTGSGTTTLASGSVLSDSRTIVNTSPNKRLLLASSLIRHNFNAADATSIPVSAATDFNYSAGSGSRITRARIESTTKPDDDAGFSPVYSSVHMALVSDAEFTARNTASSSFLFNTALVNTANISNPIAQHVHSSDSIFAFIPIKTGVRYSFEKNYKPDGQVYRVAEAGYFEIAPLDLRFCIVLTRLNGAATDPFSFDFPLKLRITIDSYRNETNRLVKIDVPVISAVVAEGKSRFVIDDSYRWFVEQILPNAQFRDNSTVNLMLDSADTLTRRTDSTVLVTRPVVTVNSLPVDERGSGDSGASNTALLSLANDRNLLIGEFSLSLNRPDAITANVKVNQGPTQTPLTTYGAGDAKSVSSFNPDKLQLIIDEAGNLKGRLEQYKNGVLEITTNIAPILPSAVKKYINDGGKFSKVVVGEFAFAALSADSPKKLFIWGSNVFGHLIPDVDTTTYANFVKNGYIEDIVDFDIGSTYMCVITGDGKLHCWGCKRAVSNYSSDKSPWLLSNLTSEELTQQRYYPYLDGAVGDRHMVLKQRTADGSATIRQYGELSANPPYFDGWSVGRENTVACGINHVIALRADGTVSCWGDNTYTQCTVPSGLTNVIAVAAGDYHSVALTNDGTIYAWGLNNFNQCNIQTVSGLKAKAIFAGGSYSGAIRASTATDITDTLIANYNDVEDTVYIVGDNTHFIQHIPTCEGKSYDPYYPRYRMKFHKVIAGWDHVVGIRKVESEKAGILHPELCHFVNEKLMTIPFKVGSTVIFSNLHWLHRRRLIDDIAFVYNESDSIYYHPNATGITSGSVSYRIAATYDSSCSDIRYKIQRKPSGGSWTDVNFNIDFYDSAGLLAQTTTSSDIRSLSGIWFTGANTQAPGWAVGVGDPVACDGIPDNSVKQIHFTGTTTTGETITLNVTPAEVYGETNTNYSVICWGNPMAYALGYRRDDYNTHYQVPSNIFNSTNTINDNNSLSSYVTQTRFAVKKHTLSGYPIENDFCSAGDPDFCNSYNFEEAPYIKNTASYMGYRGFAEKIAPSSTLAPLVLEGSSTSFYLGPTSIYLIPAGQALYNNYSVAIMRTELLNSSTSPETAILNCPLPISNYAAGKPKINSYLTNYGPTPSPYGVYYLNNPLGVAEDTFKSFNATTASKVNTTFNISDKWLVLADTATEIQSYGWGTSPTGFWYVYNNTVEPVAELANRYYNFTGIYGRLNSPHLYGLEVSEVAICPFETSNFRTLVKVQLQAVGLDIRRIYVAQHQINSSWSYTTALTNPPAVQAGKHITVAPNPLITGEYHCRGLLFSGYDLNIPDGYIPNTPSFASYRYFTGYRSLYALELFQNPLQTTVDIGFRSLKYLSAIPTGNNSYGQLNTPEHTEAFISHLIFPDLDGTISVSPFGENMLIDVGQLNCPNPQGTESFTQISCSQYHALALDTRGKIYAWGSNNRHNPLRTDLKDWNPSIGGYDTAAGQSEPYLIFYTASLDTYKSSSEQPVWGENYVHDHTTFGSSVAPALLPISGGFLAPYATTPLPNAGYSRMGNISAGTFWRQGGLAEVSNLIFTQASDYRNGKYEIGLAYDETGVRVKVKSDLTDIYTYSNYAYTADPQLFNWEVTSQGVAARFDGRPVTWGSSDDLSSGAISEFNPAMNIEILTTDSPGYLPRNFSLEALNGKKIIKLVAGKTFSAVHVEVLFGSVSEKRLVVAEEFTIPPFGFVEPVEDISVGSYEDDFDVLLKKVLRTFAVGNPPISKSINLISQTKTNGENVAFLDVPASIQQILSGVISEETFSKLKNVVEIAAGRNVMFAIVNDFIENTPEGEILAWGNTGGVIPPTGNTWKKIASSNNQNLGTAWSHAAAINAAGTLKIWGVDSYWNTVSTTGTYFAVTCTNNAVIAINSDYKVIVFSQSAEVQLPSYLVNVKFKSVSGGQNHVIGVIKEAFTISTPEGPLSFSPNDVVAWGNNSQGQCNIPGTNILNPALNKPIQSEYVAAGNTYSLVYRALDGIVIKNITTLNSKALALYSAGAPDAMLKSEGYIMHTTNQTCNNFFLPETHTYYKAIPVIPLAEASQITGAGHIKIPLWTTDATEVPADFKSTSTSSKRAKLICAGRFKSFRRDTRAFMFGSGYNVFVEEGDTDLLHVFGGLSRRGLCLNPPSAAEIAINSIPPIEPGTKIYSLSTHLGYICALQNTGAVTAWGYGDGYAGYYSLYSENRKYLATPANPVSDTIGFTSPSYVEISYISGVPELERSWSCDVILHRHLNGVKASVRKYTVSGSVDVASIANTIYFAQAFTAVDTWPAAATALDSYYTLDVQLTGGGTEYKVYSASLFAMNLDSKTTAGNKILIEANAAGTLPTVTPDYAIMTETNATPTRTQINTGAVSYTAVTETANNFEITYSSVPSYPAYIQNDYGNSARTEFVDPSALKLITQGRIGNVSSSIIGLSPFVYWAHTTILPASGANNAAVTGWTGTSGSLIPQASPVATPTLVSPFTTNTRALKLVNGTTASESASLRQYTPDFIESSFTYFIVKKNAIATGNSTKHAIFVGGRTNNTLPRVQGIGEVSKKPAIIFFDANSNTVKFREINTAVSSSANIICAFYGSNTDYGIRINGNNDSAWGSSLSTIAAGNINIPLPGYYLGDSNINNTYRDANTEIAEVIVFNRKLTYDEIKFVEGYLAWRFGLNGQLPANHPYKLAAPQYSAFSQIQPFDYEEPITAFIDIDQAAKNKSEDWITLYDVQAEYTAPRLFGTQILTEHAPIVAELTLDKVGPISFTTSVVSCGLSVNNPELEVDSGVNFYAIIRGVSTLTTIPDALDILRQTSLTGIVANRLSTAGALTLDSLNLPAVPVFGSLNFVAGINCDGPYGCTDIGTDPPNLTIIQTSSDFVAIGIRCNANVLINSNTDFGIQLAPIRYSPIFGKLTVNDANLILTLNMLSSNINAQLVSKSVSMPNVYGILGAAQQIAINCTLNVRTCDASGFKIIKPKVTPTPPLFPVNTNKFNQTDFI